MPDYKEYMGEDYHNQIRKLLSLQGDEGKELLPDRIIDADLHIGTMRKMISDRIGVKYNFGLIPKTEEIFALVQEAARYLLAGLICSALKSRTEIPEFRKHQKNWGKKQVKLMQRYELFMRNIEEKIELAGGDGKSGN
jgi:hypothetical protein